MTTLIWYIALFLSFVCIIGNWIILIRFYVTKKNQETFMPLLGGILGVIGLLGLCIVPWWMAFCFLLFDPSYWGVYKLVHELRRDLKVKKYVNINEEYIAIFYNGREKRRLFWNQMNMNASSVTEKDIVLYTKVSPVEKIVIPKDCDGATILISMLWSLKKGKE